MKGIELIKSDQESLLYFPEIYDVSFFNELRDQIHWQQNSIKIYGKTHLEPRLTAWFGPPYKYSGISWSATPFHPIIDEIHLQLVHSLQQTFNAVLLNYYRNGADGMGWHRDNEKELDQGCIASVSFGGARKFQVRNIHTKDRMEMILEDRSLLVMKNLQVNWQHALPKTKRFNDPRINLTFRNIHV
jgi:alkylated DNA repair dioxygenase AlkB